MGDQHASGRKASIVMRIRTCHGCGAREEGSLYGLSAVPADCWRCPVCQCTAFEMIPYTFPG